MRGGAPQSRPAVRGQVWPRRCRVSECGGLGALGRFEGLGGSPTGPVLRVGRDTGWLLPALPQNHCLLLAFPLSLCVSVPALSPASPRAVPSPPASLRGAGAPLRLTRAPSPPNFPAVPPAPSSSPRLEEGAAPEVRQGHGLRLAQEAAPGLFFPKKCPFPNPRSHERCRASRN